MQQQVQQAIQQSMQQSMQQSLQQSLQPALQQSIQPMQQQEQNLAVQQMQQQMMLCPVRVVYETQILMQPGEQMQPNQTLFINPQNTPPWVQNRQMQNQVIYVQQMPNNIISTVPQHIDQNQLYLQHYQNYQQMIPQQMIAQNQEQRHIQLPNVIPQNMVQNFQANIGGNIQNISERLPQSYGHIQHIGQTIQMPVQTQHNLPTSNVNRNEQNIQIVQQPQSAAVQSQNQRAEMRPGVYMNVSQQTNQQPIRSSPQVLTVNPIPNAPQTSTNFQPTMPPTNIPRSIQTQSVGSQMSPPTFAQPRMRKVAPSTVNKVTNTNVGVRGMGQTYRPIQPRPQQYRNSAPSYPNSIEIQAQPNKPTQSAPSVPNIINMTSASTLPSMPNLQMNVPNTSMTYIKTEDITNYRKRKSESPDEIHKKMAAIQVNITTPLKPVIMPQRSIEVSSANINITQKVEQKPNISFIPQPFTIINTVPQAVEFQEISKLVENVQQAIQIDKINIKPIQDVKESSPTEKDKLVRNTVYTQARGRVLTDKEAVTISKETNNVLKQEPQNNNTNNPSEIKQEKPETVTKIVPEEVKEKKVEVKLRKDVTDTSITLKTPNNKGMLPVGRSTKQERDFVLTHVLDGIVIQESNVAFPIRDPATRRFIQPAPVASVSKKATRGTANFKQPRKEEVKTDNKHLDMPLLKEEVKEDIKTAEVKTDGSDNGDKSDKSTLQDEVEEGKSNSEELDKAENPFLSVQHGTVKSWTVEQLSAHVSTYKWSETASLLSEHEIDGESLFLVSKTQLLTIGVKENHADLICGFVKS